MNIEIRALRKEDRRQHFECGDAELSLFFHKYAAQNQFKHYIGTTYVALIDNIIVGYITLNVSSIKISDYETWGSKLPQYPLPILRISRLAIDKTCQKQGIGKALLKFALSLSVEQKKMLGCIGIIVDAKRKAVAYYEQFGFKPINIISGKMDVRPFPQPMFLSMDVVLKVRKSK